MKILPQQTVMLLVICMVVNAIGLLAQKQNNQWRFGYNGAVNFNTSPPSAPSGCAMQTPEGSASVADRVTGELLFYTDGITVWNAGNQPMPNGAGLLGGTSTLLSSTTAAVIIPKPLAPDIYYVVTIDEQSSGNGIRYSVVDMSLNGGLGDVVAGQKNLFLFSTTSEKLHVVPTADGCGFWLLTHDNPGNTFAAFKITQNGFDAIPVLSSAGGTQGNGAGHIKVNRQLNKLAMGNLFDATIELFDFDNTTGVVSTPLVWDFSFPNALIYGVEFSPDGSKLYVSNIEKIIQYDISQPNAAAIEASAFDVSQNAGVFYQPATLQLGPDNKIYVAAGSVDVIQFPDQAGAGCGFQRNPIPALTGTAGYGLPQWINFSDCNNGITGIKIDGDTCNTSDIRFQAEGTSSSPYFFWNFGDPAGGTNDTVTITGTSPSPFPTHSFSGPGVYEVCVSFQEPGAAVSTVCRSISIGLCCQGGVIVAADSCLTRNIGFSVVTGGTVNSIIWNFGDPASGMTNTVSALAPLHVLSDTGTYTVRAIVNAACGLDTIFQTLVVVSCDCKVYIPNAFTPNGDGANDTFGLVAFCDLEQLEMSVYSRWGELVYQTGNPSGKWDGKYKGSDCSSDVYVYVIHYKRPAEPEKTVYGDVTLLR